jgi:hypothetical protein
MRTAVMPNFFHDSACEGRLTTASASVVMVRENLESKEAERMVGRFRMFCKTFGFETLLYARETNVCGRHCLAARKTLELRKGRRDVDSPTRNMTVEYEITIEPSSSRLNEVLLSAGLGRRDDALPENQQDQMVRAQAEM